MANDAAHVVVDDSAHIVNNTNDAAHVVVDDTAHVVANSGKTVDVTTLPFAFNPPPHPSILHKVPDLSTTSANYAASVSRIYDETGSLYAADAAKTGGTFSTLRLGRIIMWDNTLTYAMKNAGTRYGFRFLYNPTTLSGTVNVGTDFIPDPTSSIGGMLQTGIEQIQITQLLINRMPEVQGRAQPEDYAPLKVTGAEMKEMRERGTHYDIEFLYRVANGVHYTDSRQLTGDIGILLPNPCELHLGPYRSRGALFTVSVTDQMYSADMVPMLSYVNITFSRYLTFNVNDPLTKTALKATGVTFPSDSSNSSGSTDSGSSSSSSSGPSSGGGSTPMTGGQVQQLAKNVGFSDQDSVTMTKIAWAESRWNPKSHNDNPSTKDNSYGLWQINMLAHTTKEFGIGSNDELLTPPINAHAAFVVWKNAGRKFSPWTTWKTGAYTKAPSW
jgi:Lysozyme like domain